MATLKNQIDTICKELEVTVKEGGLIAQVKAAAEACGLEYTTLKDTAATLVKEVLGETEDAPAADGDGGGDGDAVLTKVRTAEQRAAESQAKAVREGRVQEIDDDDEEPVSSPPAKKPKKEFPKAPATAMRAPAPKKSAAPCCCDALARNYDPTSRCKATAHACICATRGPDKCRSAGPHPCLCDSLVRGYDPSRKCKAAVHNCICARKPSECRAPAGTCECSCSKGFAKDCRFTGEHPCSCKTLSRNYDPTSYCKATHSHYCFCAEGKPEKCREH